MANSKNKIFSADEVAVISEAVRQSSESTETKLKNINWLMAGVVVVTFIGFLTMIVMVATSIIDSFHINSAAYKDYSEKIETLNILQETNKKQLELTQENQKKQEELFKNCINK